MIYPINWFTHFNTVAQSVYQISSTNTEQNPSYKHLSSNSKKLLSCLEALYKNRIIQAINVTCYLNMALLSVSTLSSLEVQSTLCFHFWFVRDFIGSLGALSSYYSLKSILVCGRSLIKKIVN